MLAELSAAIVDRLLSRKERLATAESCTGGGICAALTSIPDSSMVIWGGFISYADEAKCALLDVDPELLRSEGSVSSGVAKAMAWGAQKRSDADWTLAVTGIAGPSGGTPSKPVGTVWIAWCGPGSSITAEVFQFGGDRNAIRTQTAVEAMKGLLTRVSH